MYRLFFNNALALYKTRICNNGSVVFLVGTKVSEFTELHCNPAINGGVIKNLVNKGL